MNNILSIKYMKENELKLNELINYELNEKYQKNIKLFTYKEGKENVIIVKQIIQKKGRPFTEIVEITLKDKNFMKEAINIMRKKAGYGRYGWVHYAMFHFTEEVKSYYIRSERNKYFQREYELKRK